MIGKILTEIGKGILARELTKGGGSKTKTASDYFDELVAERVSLDEYMRTTNVTGKTKGKSFAAQSVSPESGIMAYRRAVEKMRSS
jgi:hypothetical protein|tara:strand:+ start:103 stop:360 length:258 start_codon:yes stop_codon:yes gene_type:complete